MKHFFFLLLISFSAIASAQTAATSFEQWHAHRDTTTFKDEFIEVTEEPKPLQNIQSLVVYPEKAKKSGKEGKVTFSALIGTDGKVEKVTIDKSDNKIFDQAVIDAVKNAEFKPALGGDKKPVRIWYTNTITFKIEQTGVLPDRNSH